MEKRIILGLTGGMWLALLFQMRNLQYLSGMADWLVLSFAFTLIFFITLLVYRRMLHADGKELLLTGGLVALTILARTAMLDFASADYDSFLTKWVLYFREHGAQALAENVGDYNLLYQYALFIISRIPIHDLYLIKLFSVAFDYALALAMARASGNRTVFLVTLMLPTVLLDGSCWGQCDSVYAFLIVMSFACLQEDRPTLSAVFLAIGFAFKLQTIFFFPVVLLGLLQRRFRPKHAIVFFAAYAATIIPAVMVGRSVGSALSVYLNQSMGQYYHRLSYNAPNLYLFFPMLEFASSQEYTWMRFIQGVDAEGQNAYLTEALFPTLQQAALIACILLVLLVVAYWIRHRGEIMRDQTLVFTLFFLIFLPFVMPKIHDRYFYLADLFSVLYAASRPDRRFLPVLTVGASLECYMTFLTRQRPVDERILALMMLAALIIVAHDLLVAMRRNREVTA